MDQDKNKQNNRIPFFNRGDALEQIRRLNPLIGVQTKDLVDTSIDVVEQIAKRPIITAQYFSQYLNECGRIIRGQSTVKPKKGDNRYTDPAWHDNLFFKRAMQIHLVADQLCQAWADENFKDLEERERVKFVLSLITEAFSPPNSLFNPVLIKRIVETGGSNVATGLQQLRDDTLRTGNLFPSARSSKEPAYRVGETIATSPSKPIFVGERASIDQYQSEIESFPVKPLLFIPSHLNQGYVFDLTPEMSCVRFVQAAGFHPFVLNWTNPTADNRDWGLDEYLDDLIHGLTEIATLTEGAEIQLVGMGTGGIMAILAEAVLNQPANQEPVSIASITCIATVLGGNTKGDGSLFAGEEAIQAAKARSDQAGILESEDLAQLFTWLRSDAFTWTSRISHYFTGQTPLNGELSFWLEDTLNLPAKLHQQLLDGDKLFLDNEGDPTSYLRLREDRILNLSQMTAKLYVVAGAEDFISPWQLCYSSIRGFWPEPRFVLSSGDLSQLILNLPEGDLKESYYYTNTDLPHTPTAWRETGLYVEGSWWHDWIRWVDARSQIQ